MADTIDSIYRELKKRVPSRLKEISVDIIARYRSKDTAGLSFYAEILGIDRSGLGQSRLFARIIQQYHPDKLATILKEIEIHFKNGRLEELVRLRNMFIFEGPVSGTVYINADESYEYSGEDFGYEEQEVNDDDGGREEERDEFDEAHDDHERGFIEALTSLIFGNLDLTMTVEDVQSLDGELDLSDYDIVDLKGIEHCMNITSLNLSGNDIRSIGQLSRLTQLESLFLSGNRIRTINALAGLVNLKELDISFNEIEDISVLRKLDSLLYVNILGNQIMDPATIKELADRGVLVVY